MATDPMLPYGELRETTVRVASWNTWSQFNDWEAREVVLLQELQRVDADIVCLQEAWTADGTSQGERFGQALGLHVADGDVSDYEGVLSGCSVLSRWPIVSTESFVAGDGDQISGATLVRIDGPRGPIDVVSLIMTWRIDHSALRTQHLIELLTWLRERGDRFHPLFVCGDFNSVPESDELRAMVGLAPVHVPNMVFYDAVTMRAEGDRATYVERNPGASIGLYPDKQLDHIFSHWPKPHGMGHPIAAAVIGDEPVCGVWASDHFGVMADLRY